jgi:hypothetical protein
MSAAASRNCRASSSGVGSGASGATFASLGAGRAAIFFAGAALGLKVGISFPASGTSMPLPPSRIEDIRPATARNEMMNTIM